MTVLLQAVNNVLAAVALPPVNSLVQPVAATTALAQQHIEAENRRAQLEGWCFNTEPRAELRPDASGEIAEPSNVLRFEALDSTFYAFQNGKLRDLLNDTYTFSTAVWGKLVTLEDFENVPPWFRAMVEARAARRMHAAFRGDPAGARSAAVDERAAVADARRADSQQRRYSSSECASVRRTTHRFRRLGNII